MSLHVGGKVRSMRPRPKKIKCFRCGTEREYYQPLCKCCKCGTDCEVKK